MGSPRGGGEGADPKAPPPAGRAGWFVVVVAAAPPRPRAGRRDLEGLPRGLGLYFPAWSPTRGRAPPGSAISPSPVRDPRFGDCRPASPRQLSRPGRCSPSLKSTWSRTSRFRRNWHRGKASPLSLRTHSPPRGARGLGAAGSPVVRGAVSASVRLPWVLLSFLGHKSGCLPGESAETTKQRAQ